MIKKGFHSKAHCATAATSYARRAVLSQLLRYEQFEQFPISYVAALFKELRFQPEAAEVVEAAIRNTVAKGWWYRTLLWVGRGGLQIVCHFQNLAGRPTIAQEPHM